MKAIPNFTVAPITTFKRHHIAIDQKQFYMYLKYLKCKNPVLYKKDGERKSWDEMPKVKGWSDLWNEYLDIEELERGLDGGPRVRFSGFLTTDGVSVSFVMNQTKQEKCAEKSDEQRRKETAEFLKSCEQVIQTLDNLRTNFHLNFV